VNCEKLQIFVSNRSNAIIFISNIAEANKGQLMDKCGINESQKNDQWYSLGSERKRNATNGILQMQNL